ncbi:MAG TPA: hypothetical protein VLT91_13305 [Rhizomicrobium sp.]|nr:hypothetical protein [Rhizomicrobium sp.]
MADDGPAARTYADLVDGLQAAMNYIGVLEQRMENCAPQRALPLDDPPGQTRSDAQLLHSASAQISRAVDATRRLRGHLDL